MKSFYKELLNSLQHKKGIVAIDGRCGSGKSELSRFLSQELKCVVIHMDDYYKPFDQRDKNWMEKPVSNMDIERIEKEVLIPASQHQDIHTSSYSHFTNSYTHKDYPPNDLVIIEGSYSLCNQLRKYYCDTIFLTCSKKTQLQRLEKREGRRVNEFETIWIPLEEKYISQQQVEEYAHYLFCTDE